MTNGPARPADAAAGSAAGSGLGLRGLEELVGEHGGALSAAAVADGYVLRATFPLRTATPVEAP